MDTNNATKRNTRIYLQKWNVVAHPGIVHENHFPSQRPLKSAREKPEMGVSAFEVRST